MKPFRGYLERLESLIFEAATPTGRFSKAADIEAALDGQPSRELRRLVKQEDLRASGAYFTGSTLSKAALSGFVDTLNSSSVVLDPACGVGDLLIACAAHLPRADTIDQTLEIWGSRLLGRDLHPEFIEGAKARLFLAALSLMPSANSERSLDYSKRFPQLEVRSGLEDAAAIRHATHIVLNPPFCMVDASKSCNWSSGTVNSAALFLEFCLEYARPGTQIAAILPDVLRSGSRYLKWRKLISSRAIIKRVQPYGRFDRWADVDVFMLGLEISPDLRNPNQDIWTPSVSTNMRIGDYFSVGVGPVVDYRDPHQGAWHPFLYSQGLPAWKILSEIPAKRRFLGRTIKPPFVVIRRTSRPGDKYRAIGTIIKGMKPVAVENHLIVLAPSDGGLPTCERGLAVLRNSKTTEWLDNRICCRHLTVAAVRDLPWWDCD